MTPPYVLWRTDAEPVVLLRDVPQVGAAGEAQAALFPAPEPARPRFRPVPAQDAARPVVDLVVTGGVL